MNSILRASNVLRTLITDKTDSVLFTCVRWRKPRWAPIAPTKLHRVKQRQEVNIEEDVEFKLRYSHYKTATRAIRKYLQDEFVTKTTALTGESHMEKEQHHQEWIIKENEEWNLNTALLRESREAELQTRQQEEEFKLLTEIEYEETKRKQEALAQLIKIKEEAKLFITPETLDAAIDVALHKRPSYCFAIDTEGRRHVEQTDGTSTIIETDESDKRTENEQSSAA